jgi:hypothetical protein
MLFFDASLIPDPHIHSNVIKVLEADLVHPDDQIVRMPAASSVSWRLGSCRGSPLLAGILS